MQITIDGREIVCEEDFYKKFYEQLGLPEWCGKNLDALWDVLTGMVSRPIDIFWINTEYSKKNLPRYREIFSLLKEAEIRDIKLGREEKINFITDDKNIV